MSRTIALPDAPAVVAGHARAALLSPDGEIQVLPAEAVAARLGRLPPAIVVHAPATFRRLGLRQRRAFDLLELFAFVRPAQPAAPTPHGLAAAVGLDVRATTIEEQVGLLPRITAALLTYLAQGRTLLSNRDAAPLAARMGTAGWGWAPFVLGALDRPHSEPSTEPLKIWKRLPEWEEEGPPPPPSSYPISDADARARLAQVLGFGAEQRPGQADYAGAIASAFAPRGTRGDPHLVLAEAGTGTGKTLGYLAPASLWAERNRGAVWISTYTRHLQRQIVAELERLFPDPTERRRKVVVRKGRENYLCLLNLEDAVNAFTSGIIQTNAIPLGLIARWAMMTDDGDIQGGDLPGWLPELYGAALFSGIADRRGECIHAACPHWRRCFIEHSIRRSRGADLVVANHALVMTQAALGGLDDNAVPTRYVFDEGHHVFDAADAAFSATLSGLETAELRRWLRGAEGSRSRARGLRRRIEELVAGRPALEAPLDAALQAALALPASDWPMRLGEQAPALAGIEPGRTNPTEAFLWQARRQVLARTTESGGSGTQRWGVLECDVHPVVPDLAGSAAVLLRALSRLAEPLVTLRARLLARLDEEADELEVSMRLRIEAVGRSLSRRAINPLRAWMSMLNALAELQPDPGERPKDVQFLRLERRPGSTDHDVGLHRHWLDPTIPFAMTLAAPAHGLAVTSATLRDAGAREPERAWAAAEARVGAVHLPSPPIRVAVASPFDYARQTRAFIVTDVVGGRIDALAPAFRALFLAAGGGALGLFTAIHRLQAVHARIAPELEAHGIPLLAQHVDQMSNATLVDVFRSEENSCLLGTDAMRDGVDVPGNALRLVVFEKVPWPRPDILHRERRIHLSDGDPRDFDDRIVRLRLRQAFGRLIRRESDHGVFVLLDRGAPTRVLSAFPEGVQVRRVGLAQAVEETAAFLGVTAGA